MKRLFVIAFEDSTEMCEEEQNELEELMGLLAKRYHFRWNYTTNPAWVDALADEMRERGMK